MEPRTILTLGARNLGGAILDHFIALGWNGAAVARSDDTLARVRERGALAIEADAADPAALERAMATTREEHGSLDLIVNALTASRPAPGPPWGGGPVGAGPALGGRADRRRHARGHARLDRCGGRAGVRVPVDRRAGAAAGRRRHA